MRHLLSIALITASVASQTKVGRSPIRVEPGVVCAGAVVEATVRVYWRAPLDGKAVAKIPASLKQLSLTTEKDSDGNAESRIAIQLVTTTVGKHEANVQLNLGDRQADVPVTWTVVPTVKNSSRILVASTPYRADASMLPDIFGTWRKLVERTQLDIDYRLSSKSAPAFTPEALSRVDIVVVSGEALIHVNDAEVARLQGFVCGGGRVVVCADAFFVGTIKAANRICEPFGLKMLNREPPIGTEHKAANEDLPRHPLSVGVKEVAVNRPSPTRMLDSAHVAPIVTLPAFGPEFPFAAIATTKSGGEVITLGNSLWWNWLSQGEGNERLMRNLLVRAPRMR